MLCAERLCELPLEVRVLVANMDIEAYTRMYLWDDEFREYATKEYAIDDFIERFVVKRKNDYKKYTLNNIEYYKFNNGNQKWYMDDKFHRIDGPAIVCGNGEQRWYMNGKCHRIDGPAIIHADGDQEWYMNGKLHRDNAPVTIYANWGMSWYVHGKLHRDDGPAIILLSGYKAYYHQGNRHRLDGPAIISDGGEEYWEYGKRIK